MFPAASDEEQSLLDLEVLLEQRISESQQSKIVAQSLTEIAAAAVKPGGGVTRSYGDGKRRWRLTLVR
ncbi:MAG: hypothetical protein KDI45_10280 [Candidatus Accumulibacter sp.]|nr:hypothetical protein [Accumulibacter sp.]